MIALLIIGIIILLYSKTNFVIFGFDLKKGLNSVLGGNRRVLKDVTNIKEVSYFFVIYSFVATFTFAAPIFSIFPGEIIESISKCFITSEPYSNIGYLSIIILILLEYLAYEVTIKVVKDYQIVKKKHLFIIMIIHYFIINTLVFYSFWGFILNFRNDGQLIFATMITHPISSILFYPLGLMMNYEIEKRKEKEIRKLNETPIEKEIENKLTNKEQ